MAVRPSLLFDEDTEAKFARLCEKDDHNVERVVDVSELGRGSTDREVRRYAPRPIELSSLTTTIS